MTTSEPGTKRKARTMISAALDDGTFAEMTYDTQTRKSSLVFYKDGKTTTSARLITEKGAEFKPLSASNNLIAHDVVLFPSVAHEFASVDQLAAEVKAFIRRFVQVSEQFEEVAVWYVFLTWVYDAFNELPYLRIKGDFGSGKSRALQAIGALCYKPMFASGASTVSPIFRIIDLVRGTLVLDESDFRLSDEKAEIVKILNNGNARGFPVLRSEVTPTKDFNPRAFIVYGPKIIATRRDFEDAALESRCITEVMGGSSQLRDIPLTLPSTFQQEARLLRNKLLLYRFRHQAQFRSATPAKIEDVEPRVAQLFAPLIAVCVDDGARQRLVRVARERTAEISADRGTSIEAQILDIIFNMQKEGATLGIREIASRFAERYGSDFDRPISPRWIGSQIRHRLSLVPIKSHGVFVIPSEALRRLDALYARYGVSDLAGG